MAIAEAGSPNELCGVGDVSVTVYDAAGRRVRTLLDAEPGRAGRNEVVWNGTDDAGRSAASGVYLVRLAGDGFVQQQRVTLVK